MCSACVTSLLRMIYNISLIRTEDYTYEHMQTNLWATAEVAFGLMCSCLVVLPRLYQHFCEITPYKTNDTSAAEYTRNNTTSHGRTKREWVQLEAQATKDQKSYGRMARLEDEQALDAAMEDKA